MPIIFATLLTLSVFRIKPGKDKDKDMTNKMTMTKTNAMKNTKTKTFREHPQRAVLETCDLRLDT